MSEVKDILTKTIEHIGPKLDDQKKMDELSKRVSATVAQNALSLGLRVNVRLAGSIAKNTWIRDRPEIDIFVLFDSTIDREKLERHIIEIGRASLKQLGARLTLRYAEHPYVEGHLNNNRINIVAAYETEKGRWLSAADRTPFHTEYVTSKMTDTARDQARLLKAFLLSCGLYGAEIRIGGFSGYLSELLTIHHQSFLETIRQAANWKPPIAIDIEKHYASNDEIVEKFSHHSLIVIDPIDKERNVSAAVTQRRLAEFILASNLFILRPSTKFFEIKEPRAPKAALLVKKIRRQKRTLLGLFFKNPISSPPDVLWGELRRSLNAIEKSLTREGFAPFRAEAWTDGVECTMLFELTTGQLFPTYLHRGPPVYLRNSLDFLLKHLESQATLAGPWVSDFRLHVEKKRSELLLPQILKSRMKQSQVSLSPSLAESVTKARIKLGVGIVSECKVSPEKLSFLADFMDGKPVFLRKQFSA